MILGKDIACARAAISSNKFVAPGISDFTSAEIPDMSEYDPESSFWLANFVLNSGLRGNFGCGNVN